jgi:hypothetical protein
VDEEELMRENRLGKNGRRIKGCGQKGCMEKKDNAWEKTWSEYMRLLGWFGDSVEKKKGKWIEKKK